MTPTARPTAQTSPAAGGIDHVTIATRDCRAAKRFYELALRPLGFSVVFDWPDGGRAFLGVGAQASSLWLVQASQPSRVALSFAAPDAAAVDAFYAGALAAGGRPRSRPGIRSEYTAHTYAAEVLDPDWNGVEAICWHADPRVRAEHAA